MIGFKFFKLINKNAFEIIKNNAIPKKLFNSNSLNKKDNIFQSLYLQKTFVTKINKTSENLKEENIVTKPLDKINNENGEEQKFLVKSDFKKLIAELNIIGDRLKRLDLKKKNIHKQKDTFELEKLKDESLYFKILGFMSNALSDIELLVVSLGLVFTFITIVGFIIYLIVSLFI